MLSSFSLNDKVAIITGGAGLLGRQHARAIAEAGGLPVLWDIDDAMLTDAATRLKADGFGSMVQVVDVTSRSSVKQAFSALLEMQGSVHILINNAAANPKVEKGEGCFSRFENYELEDWNFEIGVGLTSAFLCSQVVGSYFAEKRCGVILNIASDLSVLAPDQRLYRKEGLSEEEQATKPVTYSIVKHGIVGLARYLSTYWANRGVRVNALSPGGVFNGQDDEFVSRIEGLIPMGRMAKKEDYEAAVVFLCSDASSYMTGQNIVMDGGRSVW